MFVQLSHRSATFKSTLMQQTVPSGSLWRSKGVGVFGLDWEEQTCTEPFIERPHQVLAGHFANANHPDCIWRNRLIIEGCIHKQTGAGGRGLIVFGSHGVVCFQKRLQIQKKKQKDGGEADDMIVCTGVILYCTTHSVPIHLNPCLECLSAPYAPLGMSVTLTSHQTLSLHACELQWSLTWKWGSFSMRTSSSAAWLLWAMGLSSLRMSWTSSTLFSLTASSLGSSNCSWACYPITKQIALSSPNQFVLSYGQNNKMLKQPPAENNAQLKSQPGDTNKPWKLNTNWSQILCSLGLGVLVWNINISREFIFHSSSAAKDAGLTGYWTWLP